MGLGIGPLAQGGLDEALGFAVGFRRVGFGPDVFEAEIAASAAECEGFVTRSVSVITRATVMPRLL